MAAGQLSLTRRALLAACAAPALAPPRHPGLDPGSMNTEPGSSREPCSWIADQVRNDAWGRTLAHYRTCDAALAAAAHTDDQDLYDRLGERRDDALQSLLHTPAPDVAALAIKLDLALDERTLEYFGDLAGMKAIKEDARRLS
jgi:hypothetical protein